MAKMFNIVMLIMFIGFCINILAGLSGILSFKILRFLVSIGGLVIFVSFIMLHVVRFGNPGKFCSGDYNSDS